MRYLVIFILLSVTASGQALRDLNYSFLYNPQEPIDFQMKVTRSSQGWTVLYALTLRDTTQDNDFLIQWDVRKELGDKEGTPVTPENIVKKKGRSKTQGSVTLPIAPEKQFLTAKILNNTVKRAWIFHKTIEPNFPTTGYLTVDGVPVVGPFLKVNTPTNVVAEGNGKIVSFYSDNFPAAVPGFSEGMAKVAKGMTVDSTFSVDISAPLTFSKTGLYLLQNDTTATTGIAFRVEDDYPRLSKIESLADPLIYICTKQEFARIKQAKGDKKAFDRVILAITQDTERARNFMRSYFRRVELANQFFTSYKEGWKTDRGMIYIIFGPPDQVFKFADREVWSYKNNLYKITFDFVKSSTLFDPENYVLIRDRKFQETWYEVIDLWRNARF
jgi:GWxTD domain-containing protein